MEAAGIMKYESSEAKEIKPQEHGVYFSPARTPLITSASRCKKNEPLHRMIHSSFHQPRSFTRYSPISVLTPNRILLPI